MPEILAAQERSTPMEPPIAKKVPHVVTLHGDKRVDDYYWLREKTNPEVIAYLERRERLHRTR